MTAPQTAPDRPSNRWLIASMGLLLQVALGTVYAWSYFQRPVAARFQCSQSAAAWAFSTAICFLGIAAALGGVALPRLGPLRLALAGAVLYPLGWWVASVALAHGSLPWFYVGYGVIGGVGLGLGYVTPVATAAKWFPDRKGLVTGMVLMGFGFGALLMSKLIGPLLMKSLGNDLSKVFLYAGLVIAALAIPAAAGLRNPPAAPVTAADQRGTTSGVSHPAGYRLLDCLRSGRFAGMWGVFFCNITAGIMFIGFQSPMLQDLLRRADPGASPEELAAAGATLIGLSSVCNGLGRIFWGGVADRVGRLRTFRFILGTQVLAFVALVWVANPWVFGLLVCYVLLCYGGGFGTMPGYVLDTFGSTRMPAVYGAVLTAWSMAGIVGPQLAALIKDKAPADLVGTCTFGLAAALLAIGWYMALNLSNAPLDLEAQARRQR